MKKRTRDSIAASSSRGRSLKWRQEQENSNGNKSTLSKPPYFQSSHRHPPSFASAMDIDSYGRVKAKVSRRATLNRDPLLKSNNNLNRSIGQLRNSSKTLMISIDSPYYRILENHNNGLTFPMLEALWYEILDCTKILSDAIWTPQQKHIIIDAGDPIVPYTAAAQKYWNKNEFRLFAQTFSNAAQYIVNIADQLDNALTRTAQLEVLSQSKRLKSILSPSRASSSSHQQQQKQVLIPEVVASRMRRRSSNFFAVDRAPVDLTSPIDFTWKHRPETSSSSNAMSSASSSGSSSSSVESTMIGAFKNYQRLGPNKRAEYAKKFGKSYPATLSSSFRNDHNISSEFLDSALPILNALDQTRRFIEVRLNQFLREFNARNPNNLMVLNVYSGNGRSPNRGISVLSQLKIRLIVLDNVLIPLTGALLEPTKLETEISNPYLVSQIGNEIIQRRRTLGLEEGIAEFIEVAVPESCRLMEIIMLAIPVAANESLGDWRMSMLLVTRAARLKTMSTASIFDPSIRTPNDLLDILPMNPQEESLFDEMDDMVELTRFSLILFSRETIIFVAMVCNFILVVVRSNRINLSELAVIQTYCLRTAYLVKRLCLEGLAWRLSQFLLIMQVLYDDSGEHRQMPVPEPRPTKQTHHFEQEFAEAKKHAIDRIAFEREFIQRFETSGMSRLSIDKEIAPMKRRQLYRKRILEEFLRPMYLWLSTVAYPFLSSVIESMQLYAEKIGQMEQAATLVGLKSSSSRRSSTSSNQSNSSNDRSWSGSGGSGMTTPKDSLRNAQVFGTKTSPAIRPWSPPSYNSQSSNESQEYVTTSPSLSSQSVKSQGSSNSSGSRRSSSSSASSALSAAAGQPQAKKFRRI